MKFEKITWRQKDALKIEISTMQIIVLIEHGPRIVDLRKPGSERNVLYVDYNFSGEQAKRRGDWKVIAGHRVWPHRPGADECEETYATDNDPCEVLIGRVPIDRAGGNIANSITIIGPEDRTFGILRSLTISDRIPGVDGCLDILNVITNTSDMQWSGGVWSLTCTNPEGCEYMIPIPAEKPSSGWSGFSVRYFPHWGGHSSPFPNPQVEFGRRYILISPKGQETKMAVEVPEGWIGCKSLSHTFIKMFPYNRQMIGRYPYGCNCAFYIGPNNFMFEMESMGPWSTLYPGETISHTERWALLEPTATKVDPGKIQGLRVGLDG